MSQRKAQLTQRLVNAFPEWADIRTDEQSLGFQYVNFAVGQHLDELNKQLIRTGNNQFLGTATITDPDVFYSLRLPGSYEFQKSDEDETELLYDTPVVTGMIDATTYDVSLAEGNNIRGFWLEAVPSRVELGATHSGVHILMSGTVDRSPFLPLNTTGVTHTANHLSITISGGTNYIDIDGTGNVLRGLVQLDGETREGQFLTEELFFIQDDTKKTQHDFVSVSGLRMYGIDEPNLAYVTVKSADFNAFCRPTAFQELDYAVSNEPMPTFWKLEWAPTLAKKCLSYQKYDAEQWDLRMAGFIDRSSLVDIELLNTSGTAITPIDIAVEPNSDRLWVVDTNTLYCFDAYLPYPNLSVLTERHYDAASKIEPSSYYVLRGDDVELDYIWRRPTVGIVKHRAWVQKPDGNKYTLLSGVEGTYDTGVDSWVWGEPLNRQLRTSEIYTLNQLGEYIYSLEVYYTDDTTSIDQRVVMVPSKTALAQFALSSIGFYRPITGIDIDSECKIWVLNDQDGKHEVIPHWDLMIIDYKNKVVYFREGYDSIRIID